MIGINADIIVIEIAVTDFGYVVVGSRAIPGAALFNFFEQTDFAEKVARAKRANEDILVVLDQKDIKSAFLEYEQAVPDIPLPDNRMIYFHSSRKHAAL